MYRPNRPSACGIAASCIALLAGALPATALSGPIDAALAITASLNLGPNSVDPLGGGTRTGTLQLRSGGAVSQTSIDGTTITGALPLLGALTDVDDGFVLNLSAAGVGIGAISGLTIGDLSGPGFGAINLVNTDAARVFDVTFAVDFDLSVSATGDDAISAAGVEILNAALVSLIDSVVEADSFFGPVSDSDGASQLLSLSIGPGQNQALLPYVDVYGIVDQFGFGTPADTYSAVGALTLRLVAATPRAVVAPPSWILLGLGLFALRAMRKTVPG